MAVIIRLIIVKYHSGIPTMSAAVHHAFSMRILSLKIFDAKSMAYMNFPWLAVVRGLFGKFVDTAHASVNN